MTRPSGGTPVTWSHSAWSQCCLDMWGTNSFKNIDPELESHPRKNILYFIFGEIGEITMCDGACLPVY